MRRRGALLALLLPLLGGCATVPPPPEMSPPEAEVHFGVYAQIVVQVPQRGKRKFLAVWRRVEAEGAMQDEVEVKNHFGNTEARLIIQRDGAVLQYGSRILRERDGSALAMRVFGVPLPVSAFHHWINAAAAPGDATVAKNKDGNVRSIRQFGWYINYLAYDDAARPEKISMVSPEFSALVEVEVRRWL